MLRSDIIFVMTRTSSTRKLFVNFRCSKQSREYEDCEVMPSRPVNKQNAIDNRRRNVVEEIPLGRCTQTKDASQIVFLQFLAQGGTFQA